MFLDRDGVLNLPVIRDGLPYPPAQVAELHLAPGAPEACARLRQAGLMLVVVTNQPDVARGLVTMSEIDVLNAALLDRISIDAVLVCPHDDADGCQCRKPAPGLLLTASARWQLDLGRSVMVGDRWRDVEAGQRAGCRTVHIDWGYAERAPEGQDLTVRTLAEAVPWIIAQTTTDFVEG